MTSAAAGAMVRASRHFPLSLTACALVLALLHAAVVPAQPTGTAPVTVVHLYVVTAADVPVPLAEVTVKLGRVQAVGRADSAGVVVLHGLTAGEWRASVRRMGYKTVVVDVPVRVGENAFTVTVDDVVETLESVEVVAERPWSRRLAGFEQRRQHRDASAIITRSDIDKRDPVRLSQMLRGVAGIRIADSLGSTVAVSTRGQKPSLRAGSTGMYCLMRVAVDGNVLGLNADIDNVVPKDVHGIEVFIGPSRVPPQFDALRLDNWCGLVAIWTRDR